ncbi:MAG: hypothetical protein HFH60_07015 [Lachnospiraceae bacterium]|nr:hypothetical protein [Lachnospiraceae bacterium]
MRNKLYKKLSLLCLSVMLAVAVFPPNILVYGASGNGTSIYEDVREVTDRSVVLTRGNYLNYGTVTLTQIDIMKIRITGDTAAHRVCDKLGLGLYLEQSSDGDNYTNYRYWKFSKENDSFFWKGLELIVPRGYWYRLAGGHVAIVGDDGESTSTLTKGLYVH